MDPSLAETILKVRKFFEKEKEQGKQINVTRPVLRTSECLKVSESTVVRVTKKARSGEKIKEI